MSLNTVKVANLPDFDTPKTSTRKPAGRKQTNAIHPKKIWIDLDNSPHVPFFMPIIRELGVRGYDVLLTARDSYQVCDLLKFFDLHCKVAGKHYGKSRFLKLAGTGLRSLQLMPWAIRHRPDLALSHGSRAQAIAATMLGIPTAVAFDYEFASKPPLINQNWIFVPNVIPDSALTHDQAHTLKYPGLKEDVYVPKLRRDPSVLKTLGIAEDEIVVTVRPPASEAHYHNPESDVLFTAALNYLIGKPQVRIVLLPRNQRQAELLQHEWAKPSAEGKIIFPEQVVDGLNLIWFSDLVISGGGTMNREAASLGVPVYSIFRGKIGAVDRYLAKQGRLVLLESPADIESKVVLARREKWLPAPASNNAALECILSGIVSIVENQRLPAQI